MQQIMDIVESGLVLEGYEVNMFDPEERSFTVLSPEGLEVCISFSVIGGKQDDKK